jgi:Na+/H+ antiporter NhaC
VEFTKIAEIIGTRDLLVSIGILIAIIAIETTLLGYLVYYAGSIRKLFSVVFDEHDHRTSKANKKRKEANPRVDSKCKS